ncbi:MAG: dihydropteroate synthase [Patescibacteria group bacterium]|nr:dihydropteroate synthase [Patescibacteria group bacterium]
MKKVRIGKKEFAWGTKTYLMGIVNVTPDSFSGDGHGDWDSAVAHGLALAEEGADILDIGGESTRPTATPVSLEDELARVIPVIRRLAKETDVPISVDTYKAEVARQAIGAGARMVNDVWGLTMDADMARVVAEAKVPAVLMHNRSAPKNAEQEEKLGGRFVGVTYGDLIADVKKGLKESVRLAHEAGVEDEHIILDPGIGFGKTVEQSMELVRRFHEFCDLEYPLLAGPSRKSFVGYTLKLPVEERLEGTLAAAALLIDRSADILRVHDVKEVRRAAALADAVVRP